MAYKYSAADYVFQFITVTAGVLIALLINGVDEWQNDRDLVAQARATLQREIADNKKDLDLTLSGLAGDQKGMDNAIRFADDILRSAKTSMNQISLHYNLADLSDTSWRTADRTGALSQMDYAEVQKLSRLYDQQDLFVQQQRLLLSQPSAAAALQ